MAGTLVANTINTDTGLFSTNNAYSGIAKAWVSFNGITGTVYGTAFNVSSITRNSAGDYSVAFGTAMPSANYVITGSVSPNSTYPTAATNGATLIINGATGSPYKSVQSTTSFRIIVVTTPTNLTTLTDPEYVSLSVFSS